MNLYEKFGTNSNLEINGITIEIGDSNFRVARLGGANKKYSEIMANLFKPNKRKFELGLMDGESQTDLLIKGFVKGALLGWENVKDRNDKELEFNEKNAIKLFKDIPELFFALEDTASKYESFQIEEAEEIAKK